MAAGGKTDRRRSGSGSGSRAPAKGGRATPKGTKAGGAKAAASRASGRYTPPIPREVKVSPRWLGPLIIALLVLGLVVIVLDYLGVLPGGTSNWYLFGGLFLIASGFLAATRYR